jgi:hypothetical protein
MGPEDGGSRFLRKVFIELQTYMSLLHRIPTFNSCNFVYILYGFYFEALKISYSIYFCLVKYILLHKHKVIYCECSGACNCH